MRILLTGATGYVGSRLVTGLIDSGHEVVVTSRNTDRVAAYGWFDDVKVVSMDARQCDSATAAFDAAGDIDVVPFWPCSGRCPGRLERRRERAWMHWPI